MQQNTKKTNESPPLKAGDPCECGPGKGRLYRFDYTDSHGRKRKELLCSLCKLPHWDNYDEIKSTD